MDLAGGGVSAGGVYRSMAVRTEADGPAERRDARGDGDSLLSGSQCHTGAATTDEPED